MSASLILVALLMTVAQSTVALSLSQLLLSVENEADNQEIFNFTGFRVIRRSDENACLIIRINGTTSNEPNTGGYPFLADFSTIESEVKIICGEQKMTVLYIAQAPSAEISNFSSSDDRTFLGNNLNATLGIGSIAQIIQSLFGVWSFAG